MIKPTPFVCSFPKKTQTSWFFLNLSLTLSRTWDNSALILRCFVIKVFDDGAVVAEIKDYPSISIQFQAHKKQMWITRVASFKSYLDAIMHILLFTIPNVSMSMKNVYNVLMIHSVQTFAKNIHRSSAGSN